jgi:hypothetical protein
MSRPAFTHDLLASERNFVAAMTRLGFGRFEFLQISRGELVLDSGSAVVRDIKFGSQDPSARKIVPVDFQLKPQVAELFEYVRDVDAGEIRELEIRHGLPFSMEVELAGAKLRAIEKGQSHD